MIVTAPGYHIPVLLKESVDGLQISPEGIYVDVTFGGGGHSREILSRLGSKGHLYSFDQDADAEQNIPADEQKFTFVRSNFRYLRNWMRYYGVEGIDGLLADLGVSSHHFDDESRGFSFRFDAPLDMRMNERDGLTAADVCNRYSEEELARLFWLYGELKNGRRLANAIVRGRADHPIATVNDLITLVRIEVNHEMEALHEMLDAAISCLKPGGRLVVLTYHSLEDRMVKNYMRSGNAEGKVEEDFFGNRLSPLRPVNNKVIVPDADEQERNPRSRSAKLRIAEKVEMK